MSLRVLQRADITAKCSTAPPTDKQKQANNFADTNCRGARRPLVLTSNDHVGLSLLQCSSSSSRSALMHILSHCLPSYQHPDVAAHHCWRHIKITASIHDAAAVAGRRDSWYDPFKTWSETYTFDLLINLTEAQYKLVLGGEQLLWSEHVDQSCRHALHQQKIFWSGKQHSTSPRYFLNCMYRMTQRNVNAIPLQPQDVYSSCSLKTRLMSRLYVSALRKVTQRNGL
ncbi:uncharacterized protein HD556DRAFT_1534487 [Suillus plorans]|uniref:Beta-N-acetylhexosaminidase n=1 Tax=Suillus plorans TaxID=116603 RepID=A0A9P7DNL2_9AGAM|nr:uncharacterized protein HD556DRAFT_1534487 [Suillus plorans]KAG1799272.1 hypothetical protein HD556DRAFT_1534487 [Suillus plorans]